MRQGKLCLIQLNFRVLSVDGMSRCVSRVFLQMLSVSYEQFAVGLDNRYGQNLWDEFPEIANKGEPASVRKFMLLMTPYLVCVCVCVCVCVVLTEVILQVLDLEAEDWELEDGQMVITIFQYATYFLEHGR